MRKEKGLDNPPKPLDSEDLLGGYIDAESSNIISGTSTNIQSKPSNRLKYKTLQEKHEDTDKTPSNTESETSSTLL